MGFNICLRTDIQAQLVRQLISELILRIVSRTDGIDIELLHHLQIADDFFLTERTACVHLRFVAVHTTEDNFFSIDLDLLLIVFVDNHLIDLAEANALASGFNHIALAVLQFDEQLIEVRRICEPLLRIFHLHAARCTGAGSVDPLFEVLRSGFHAVDRDLHGGDRLIVHIIEGCRNIVIAGHFRAQASDVYVQSQRRVRIDSVLCVVQRGMYEEIAQLHIVLGINGNIAENTAQTDEVLVLQEASVGPTEYLHGQRIRGSVCVQIRRNVKIVRRVTIFGIANFLAVHIDIIGGLHAFEGDESLTAFKALRRFKGGAVIAHRVVNRCGISVSRIVSGLEILPRIRLVGIDRGIVFEVPALVAVCLPALRHIFFVERRLVLCAERLGQPGLILLLGLCRGSHKGKIPFLPGQFLIIGRGLVLIQSRRFIFQSLLRTLIRNKQRMAGFPVYFVCPQLVVPFFPLELRVDRDGGTDGAQSAECCASQGKRQNQRYGFSSLLFSFFLHLDPPSQNIHFFSPKRTPARTSPPGSEPFRYQAPF